MGQKVAVTKHEIWAEILGVDFFWPEILKIIGRSAPKKSASEISCQISRCRVSKSASRGVPKIRVLGGENPRKIRVDQQSAGLKNSGGGGPFAWSGLERRFALVF